MVTPLAPLPDAAGGTGGLRVGLTIVKHKLGVPGGRAEVDLLVGQGPDRAEELLRLGLAAGVIAPHPQGLAHGSELLGHSAAAVRRRLACRRGAGRHPARGDPGRAPARARRRDAMASTAPPLVGYLLLGPPAGPGAPPDPGALLDALGAHSPTIEPDPPGGCWLDLRGGKRAPTRGRPRRGGPRHGLRVGLRVAPASASPRPPASPASPPCTARPRRRSSRPGDVAAFLAPLPLAGLGLDAETLDRLALVGLHTLGAVAALARGALGDYLGPDGPALEALARGEDDRPLVPARPPLVLTARRDLDWALDDRGQLALLVGRLLDPLLAYLRRHGLGATRATLLLRRGRGKPLELALALGAPSTDARAIRDGLLATFPPPADDATGEADDATAIAVTLSAPRPVLGRQASFFDVPQGRAGARHRGQAEARRRSDAAMGHLRLVDPAHPFPERRYALEPAALPGEAAT